MKYAVTISNEPEYRKLHPDIDVVELKMDEFYKPEGRLPKIMEEKENVEQILTLRRPKEQTGYTRPIDIEKCGKLIRELPIDYVDIEKETSTETDLTSGEYFDIRDELIEIANKENTEVILSSHYYEKTPSKPLSKLAREMVSAGADIPKICTFANSYSDAMYMLRLTKDFQSESLFWAMGEKGILSRYLQYYFGGAWAFVAWHGESAPGQLSLDTGRKLDETIQWLKRNYQT